MTNDLESLKVERDTLALQVEVEELRRQTLTYQAQQVEVMEAAYNAAWNGSERGFLYDQNPDSGDIYDVFNLDPRGEYWVDSIADRLDGRNAPYFQTCQELAIIRGIGRFISTVDETGIGLWKTLRNYTLGTGFDYDVACKDRKDEKSKPLCDAVAEFLRTFRNRNKWVTLESEFHKRYLRDGETFLWLRRFQDNVVAKFIEPIHVIEPPTPDTFTAWLGEYFLDWTLGIATRPNESETPIAYYVDWDVSGTNFDVIEERHMVHAKHDVDRNVKRGLSGYYPVYRGLRRSAKLIRNLGVTAAINAAIAFIREHAAGTISSEVQGAARYVTDNPANRTRMPQVDFPPGTIVDTTKKYSASPIGTQHQPALLEIGNGIKKHAGVAYNCPGYFLTGDLTDGNFASHMIGESPFVLARLVDQVTHGDFMVETQWKAVAIGVDMGVFRQFGVTNVEQIKAVINVLAKPPNIIVRNRIEENAINSALVEKQVMSRATWAEREELDYEAEQERIDQELESQRQRIDDGLVANNVDPQPTADPKNPKDGKTKPKKTRSGRARATESQGRRLQAIADIIWSDYEETP